MTEPERRATLKTGEKRRSAPLVLAEALILLAMSAGSLLSRVFGLRRAARRTVVIEVWMQNAAQAIAIAASPLIFDSGEMAIPAIVYALLMNVILLVYLKLLPKYSGETAAD